jgi:hypothetical protein
MAVGPETLAVPARVIKDRAEASFCGIKVAYEVPKAMTQGDWSSPN